MSAAEHRTGARISERDRRFALLVLMMSSMRARGETVNTGFSRSARGNQGIARWRRLMPARREKVMDPNEQPIVTGDNKERVRAGVTGHNVRYVLFASLALVVVLFVAVELVMR